MRRLRAWVTRLLGTFVNARAEHEFSAELDSHLQLHIDDNIRAGMAPAEARRRAIIALGGVEQTKEIYRDRRGLPALDALIHDARYALRSLGRSRTFAAACILTLGLGIGVNTAIFSVVHAVVLAPLPYESSSQLVTIWTSHPEVRREANAMSHENAIDLRRMLTTVSGLEMVQAYITSGTVPINGEGVSVTGALVTPRLFELLGTPPLYGRTLRDGDDSSVIVISHGFWQRQFGGDPLVVGRTFGQGRSAATVVGVMPKGFTVPYPSMLQATVSFVAGSEVDFWIPLLDPKPGASDRAARMLAVVARVKEGVSIDEARADVDSAWRQLAASYPQVNGGWSARVVPLHQQAVAPVRGAMLLLLGSVGLVLLIACVNVANLMLARGIARQRELALRAALGAKRSRLLQQVVVEGLAIAALGALAGLLLARWATPLLVRLAPAGTPRLDEVTINGPVIAFSTAIAIACGMAVSIVPALSASRISLTHAFNAGVRTTAGGSGRLRGWLVAAEVALAVILAVGAGLLGRSFLAVLNVDPGFRADHVLTMQVNAPPRHDTNEKRVAFYRQLFERLEAVPGVIAVGGNTRLPLAGTNSTTPVAVEGREPPENQWPETDFRRAVHRYFETMNIPLRRGRVFTDADHAGAPPVAIVNETLARRLFGDEDPIGHRVRLGPSSPLRQATIVGVVGDLRHQRLDVAPAPEVYINYLQGPPVAPLLVIRSAGDPAALAPSVRAAIAEVDASIVPSNVRTMDDLRTASVSQRIFLMGLVVGFGTLALVLAAVGVYGVLSLVVAERTRELGIRLALGATPRGLIATVVRQAMLLALTGIGAGCAIALATAPLIANQLFGIGPADPVTFGGVAGALLLVALTAALIPALRVFRVDPVNTLRTD